MTRDEALAVLRDHAAWTYTRRISDAMPFPGAVTDSPAVNEEILCAAGLDSSGMNGEGIAVLSAGKDEAPAAGTPTAALDDYARAAIAEELAADGEFGEPTVRHAVFGRNNMHYMNDHDISFGQEHRLFRPGFPGDSDGGMMIG